MIRTSCCDIPDDAFDLAGVCRPNGSCAIMVRRLAAIILSAALLLGASTALAGAALAGAGALAFVPFGDGPDYRFAGSFGEAGDRSGQFDDPTGIAVTQDRVFVADSRNGRIQVFDRAGSFLRAFGGSRLRRWCDR